MTQWADMDGHILAEANRNMGLLLQQLLKLQWNKQYKKQYSQSLWSPNLAKWRYPPLLRNPITLHQCGSSLSFSLEQITLKALSVFKDAAGKLFTVLFPILLCGRHVGHDNYSVCAFIPKPSIFSRCLVSIAIFWIGLAKEGLLASRHAHIESSPPCKKS